MVFRGKSLTEKKYSAHKKEREKIPLFSVKPILLNFETAFAFALLFLFRKSQLQNAVFVGGFDAVGVYSRYVEAARIAAVRSFDAHYFIFVFLLDVRMSFGVYRQHVAVKVEFDVFFIETG